LLFGWKWASTGIVARHRKPEPARGGDNVHYCVPIVSFCLLLPASVVAHSCGHTGSGYAAWLDGFKKDAVRRGIGQATVEEAFAGAHYDRRVIARDRAQNTAKYSLEKFIQLYAPPAVIALGRRKLRTHAELLAKTEKTYGVPGEVLISIWGLESGFGRTLGEIPVFRSLSTLAYDCRRSAYFSEELLNALVIADRGDMAIGEMKGAWAGEIGHTQFMASNYVRFAVDFDRDGQRDLMASLPDVFASTANFLRRNGWRAGRGWAEGQPNFSVFRRWNRSRVYQRTIAYMANRLRR